MSSKIIIALAAAGIAAFAGQASAKLNGTTVALECTIAAKEFAGPVTVKNTSGATLLPGKTITVVVKTATGNEHETITVRVALKPGQTIRGRNFYQNTGSCTASVFYPKRV
ncbi:MAG: hypothetical protein KIT16_10555 [Rhodospirillaceae bacterium]|nr:hypothetical protein [Rhodospirillaceae bacterium]